MKPNSLFAVAVAFLLTARCATAQGTFTYDQQSSIDETVVAGGPVIQQLTPAYGQSFTPDLSSVGFIRVALFDFQPGNGIGAILYVNLRSGSIGGPILGSSTPVSLSDGSPKFTTFLFNNPVAVTPGQVYYFQPVVQAGDLWGLTAGEYNYQGGSAFDNGLAVPGSDYWFREGIVVVPEPSAAALGLMGLVSIFLTRRRLM